MEIFRGQRFALSVPESEIKLKVAGPAGEANLQEDVYRPVIAALSENGFAAKSVTELAAHSTLRTLSLPQLTQALVVLTGLNHVQPAQDEQAVKDARPQVDALNAHLLERAVYTADVNYLASPVTGGGVAIGRLQQLFLRSIRRGKKAPQEWAVDIWPILEAQGQRLIRDGKALPTAVENISELTAMAQDFAAKRLPILKALHVVAGPGDAQTSGNAEKKRKAA
jgi:hypothetical protein